MNYNLALTDETLLSIEKPERYIGNEVNSVTKDKSSVDIRFAMCFPDVYEIGMSHLGIQILYGMFNSYTDVWCERVYSPWEDLDKLLREKNIPLFALESQDPVKDFDFLGFTIQYEMCYTNILQILDLSGIPLLSKNRTWDDPIVIGGGPCTYNPEPIADFFDVFYIGEGETMYRQLFDLYKEAKKNNVSREDFLRQMTEIKDVADDAEDEDAGERPPDRGAAAGHRGAVTRTLEGPDHRHRETGGPELLDDFLSHLETSRADGGADDGPEVRRAGAEALAQKRDRTLGNLQNRPFPPRMHRGDDAVGGVVQQNGNAVGRADADRDSGKVRDEGVISLQVLPRQVRPVDDRDP